MGGNAYLTGQGRQNLTSTERSDYIAATLCLMNTPAKNNLPGAKSRWDELQYVHIIQSDYIHQVVRIKPSVLLGALS